MLLKYLYVSGPEDAESSSLLQTRGAEIRYEGYRSP